MAQVSFPGVYIQEVPSGVRTITGVSTAIALFIGRSRRGQVNEPTTVLGFTDYTRAFGDDTTIGEMTDQVRQFFLNGGQQAIIVRIERGGTDAFVPLGNLAGTNLMLTAKSRGDDGNRVRARVDYNTSSPERTFNLALFREIVDANGNATNQDLETFRDLSMDPRDPRYAKTIIAQGSSLATLDVPASLETANHKGYSVSGRLAVDPDATDVTPAGINDAAIALRDILNTAIDAVNPTGHQGQFRISVGQQGLRTVTLPVIAAAANTKALIEAAINTAITASGALATASIVREADIVFLKVTANADGDDVVLDRSPSFDIAVAMGLGVAQGGLEVGAWADRRPFPSGYVSTFGDLADPNRLLTFANLPRGQVTSLTIAGGAGAISVPTINLGAAADVMRLGSAFAGDHLLNVRQNLQGIADAVNQAAAGKWRAEVHGYRLALLPTFGLSNAGELHVLATAPTNIGLAANDNIFDADAAVLARAAAFSLAGGADGTEPPTKDDFEDVFDIVDSKVDLFNIMVLPKSANDTGIPSNRTKTWGSASNFCLKKRAFLLVDAVSTEVQTMINEIVDLRVGLVKDHSAVYWPHLKIARGSASTIIDSSGTIAGVMARIDANRGVWKAPAGIEADLRGVLGIDRLMSDAENGLLNPLAVNAIRSFANGIVSWGARTVDGFDNSGNNDFKYVPVRRFELFIEESLVRGLKFAVFEPNDEQLWSQIRLAVGAFMNNLFRKGAFAGKTSREAYFVKVDSETTTQNDINLGIVNVVVGFAPLKPAEFIVVTIQQQAGQVQV